MAIVNIVVGCLCIITITVVFVFAKWMYEILNDADEPTEVKIQLVGGGKMPERKTEGAVAFDCYSRLVNACTIIEPTCRAIIPLGFAMELPEGYEAVIRPRSGLSKKGIDETIGTIDTDYRGEVMACLVNNSKEDFRVCNGERICQIVIREVPKVKLSEVSELSDTERGEGGFGHTGIN